LITKVNLLSLPSPCALTRSEKTESLRKLSELYYLRPFSLPMCSCQRTPASLYSLQGL
jgi:hypothetical protein